MGLRIPQLTAALVLTLGTAGAGYFAVQYSKMLKELPAIPERFLVRETASAHPPAAGGHGAPAADAGHGGGHGAPAAGGHGAPPADGGHGGGHGGAPAAAAPANTSPILSIDEVYANIAGEGQKSHSFALKVELELFDETTRKTIEDRSSIVRATVLETARQHDYRSLTSLTGKLYFKESLVARINEALGSPLIRDVHFSSFYLQ